MILRELIARFRVNFDERPVRKADGAVNRLRRGLVKIGGLLAGGMLVRGTKRFLQGQLDAADAVAKTADRIGVAVEQLQRWRFAAELSGVSQNVLDSSLQRLNKRIGEARKGYGRLKKFVDDGTISLEDSNGELKSQEQILMDVSNAMQGMESHADRMALATGLFSNAGADMVNLLQQGEEGVKKLLEEFDDLGGGFDRDFTDKAEQANDAMTRFNVALQSFKIRLTADVLPSVTGFLNNLAQWAKEINQDKERLERLMNTMRAFGKVAIAVGGAFLLMWLVAAAPIILTGLLIAAVGLILEDLVTLIKGGDSAFGEFMNNLLGLKDEPIDAVDLYRGAWEGLKRIFDTEIPASWNRLMLVFQTGMQRVMLMFETMRSGIVEMVSTLASLLKAFVSGDVAGIASAVGKLKDQGQDLAKRMARQTQTSARLLADQASRVGFDPRMVIGEEITREGAGRIARERGMDPDLVQRSVLSGAGIPQNFVEVNPRTESMRGGSESTEPPVALTVQVSGEGADVEEKARRGAEAALKHQSRDAKRKLGRVRGG